MRSPLSDPEGHWGGGKGAERNFPPAPLFPQFTLLSTQYSELSTIHRLATCINKNRPIPKKRKLGNQAPIKGERTPACAIAPLIKKIK